MDVEEFKNFLKDNGYELVKVKRFKNHDRVRILTPEKNILTLTLTDHLENIPFEQAKSWIVERRGAEVDG